MECSMHMHVLQYVVLQNQELFVCIIDGVHNNMHVFQYM
jgi:hypothetical protein